MTAPTYIIETHSLGGNQYLLNNRGDLTYLPDRAMRFTDKSLAWKAAELFKRPYYRAHVVTLERALARREATDRASEEYQAERQADKSGSEHRANRPNLALKKERRAA